MPVVCADLGGPWSLLIRPTDARFSRDGTSGSGGVADSLDDRRLNCLQYKYLQKFDLLPIGYGKDKRFLGGSWEGEFVLEGCLLDG